MHLHNIVILFLPQEVVHTLTQEQHTTPIRRTIIRILMGRTRLLHPLKSSVHLLHFLVIILLITRVTLIIRTLDTLSLHMVLTTHLIMVPQASIQLVHMQPLHTDMAVVWVDLWVAEVP